MKATLKNYRQSPRKMRLVAGLIRGKKVANAEVILKNSIKNASLPFSKLLNSAVANAKNLGIDKENLSIKEVRVDGGYVLKRMMPRARGSAYVIKKRTSHINLALKDDSAVGDKKDKKIIKKSVITKKQVKK